MPPKYKPVIREKSLITISVIIPYHALNKNLEKTLASIFLAEDRLQEIILVDDGKVGPIQSMKALSKVKFISTEGRKGPAYARNLGAKYAKSDIICFIDSDVTIPSDLFLRIVQNFEEHKPLDALFGSYDDDPGHRGFLSQYRNLLHHFVHQTSKIEATTFWTGCGAIKRTVFLEMQGFNGSVYKSPEVEDIDLGYRLTEASRTIRLEKDLQVKHLKAWTPLKLIRADLIHRAIPWTKLILQHQKIPNDLNLKISNKISVILVFCLPLFLIYSYWNAWFLLPFMIFFTLFLFLNYPLYDFFHHKRGKRFLLKALPWHCLFYIISGIGFSIGYVDFYLEKWKIKNKS